MQSSAFPTKQIQAKQIQAKQIVCLEHQNSYLYAEVIDIIESRQMCWGRPLVLAVDESPTIYDLRDGSDILLPVSLFRPALDTELIPLLVQIPEEQNRPGIAAQIAHRQLKDFIQKVWQDHPNNFTSRPVAG